MVDDSINLDRKTIFINRNKMSKKTTFCRTRLTLLEKIRDQHDNDAWADFSFYYRKYIYNITRRMGLNHHDAEEVVQTVIIKSWNKLPEFQWEQYIPELAWKNIENNFETNVRQVFYLIRESKNVGEIAKKLGIAESSVYVYKKRIQDKLHPEMVRLRNELG